MCSWWQSVVSLYRSTHGWIQWGGPQPSRYSYWRCLRQWVGRQVMSCTVSPHSMSHTCMCVRGRVQCASERKVEAKQSKHTHTHTGQDGDTTEPSDCSGEKYSGTERITGILFCFSVLFWGVWVCVWQVHRHMIPSFPLYFSLTTNQREKQLKDVKFCFIAGETGTDIPYLGKLILYR